MGNGLMKFPASGASDDRISELPEDVLLHILVSLPLVEAVRTCVLSRRWRHVWTRLPRLELADDDAPGVSSFADLVAGAIAGYATDVVMPDVTISLRRCQQYRLHETVRMVTSSAFLAANRATTRFDVSMALDLYAYDDDDEEEEPAAEPLILMPCFPMVKRIALTCPGIYLTLPLTGTFAGLTTLHFTGVLFSDGGEGISDIVSRRCPCLQDIDLDCVQGLMTLVLRSETVLRLRLFAVVDLERLQVVAPNLGEMEATHCFADASHAIIPTWMQLDVPKLEKLHWEDRSPDEFHGCNLPSQLSKFTVIQRSTIYLVPSNDGGQFHFTMNILQAVERTDILRLQIPIVPESIKIDNIPSFWEMDLTINKNGHRCAPTILNLLDRRPGVRKLSLEIKYDTEAEPCTANCGCRMIRNHLDDKITLRYLKWFIMKKYNGKGDETKILYTILRNAKALSMVSIGFPLGAEPPRKFYKRIHRLAPPGCTFEFL